MVMTKVFKHLHLLFRFRQVNFVITLMLRPLLLLLLPLTLLLLWRILWATVLLSLLVSWLSGISLLMLCSGGPEVGQSVVAKGQEPYSQHNTSFSL
jgi:hypothetical protein